jgi:hypothetical protein
MRKRMKLKKRSCPMCKPHKMGHDCRWKPKEMQAIRLAEQAIKNAA